MQGVKIQSGHNDRTGRDGLNAMPGLPKMADRQLPIANFPAGRNQYVPFALLPRLRGYELMLAPWRNPSGQ